MDFGLAKATSQVEITDPGVVKGKMSYLSPEAARGEEVDSRADIFAVGILLYELLTGKRLFYGETDYQTVELVRNAKIPPIKPQNPEVEPELEDIVRKALAKRKEDRYQNATDLQDALAQYGYSRGLKVIARDIAELVRQCLEDRAACSRARARPETSIIDHLLQDEIDKFTSVDLEEDPGARPLSADELSPRAGTIAEEGDFIDPRGWAEERLTPVLGIAEVDALEARKTSQDVPAEARRRRPSGTGRVPTGEQKGAPAAHSSPSRSSPPRSFSSEATPGPETLASVLEPTPAPQVPPPAAPAARGAAPGAAPAPQPPRRAGRSFLIGMAIGAVILGGVAAAICRQAQRPRAPPLRPPCRSQTPSREARPAPRATSGGATLANFARSSGPNSRVTTRTAT